MPTEGYFYSYMKIKDVGRYYQDFFDDFDAQQFEKLTADMDLEMNMKVRNLSSGMMAKLKIAVTLSRKAELYLLDEPLNGIDLLARDSDEYERQCFCCYFKSSGRGIGTDY